MKYLLYPTQEEIPAFKYNGVNDISSLVSFLEENNINYSCIQLDSENKLTIVLPTKENYVLFPYENEYSLCWLVFKANKLYLYPTCSVKLKFYTTDNLIVPVRVDFINEKIKALKEDFATFIKDKSFPLDQRWQVFCKANDELSNKGYEIIKDMPHSNYYEKYYYKDNHQYLPDFIYKIDCDLSDSQIKEIKEWILENNFKSFYNFK